MENKNQASETTAATVERLELGLRRISNLENAITRLKLARESTNTIICGMLEVEGPARALYQAINEKINATERMLNEEKFVVFTILGKMKGDA